MVDVDVVTVKLAEIADRLQRVRSRCPAEAQALTEDRDALELVSFNLILAIQACLDVASHIIADEGWRAATTLAESFVRLHEHRVISAETVSGIRPAARLRNILTHTYSTIDPAKVHRAATVGLADVERFAREVGTWVRERCSGPDDRSATARGGRTRPGRRIAGFRRSPESSSDRQPARPADELGPGRRPR